MNNQINYGEIYGLGNCPQEGCVSPDVYALTIVPSLEQIAAYNQAASGLLPTQPQTTAPSVPPMQQQTETTPYSMINQGTTINEQLPTDSSASATSPQLNNLITDFSNPFPVTTESIQYMNGFLRSQIGRRVEVEFLIGSSTIVTKEGFLLGVGGNYILLNEVGTNDLTACDFYNIKFVKFFY